ncbi:ATP-binding protein [Kitasatospora cathayae]|uniref:ATP-binding protein n=1 Tax=Kitasatospora cathayae TaxID=3004092 RepID=A0ABY7QAZ0_9ACTN|nr:ATP-binding protein [Kitasatospora sp. HUAS 3-15]WBP89599.1 ATP-binding protein [Kitasatospora sp. HUAS 3-15]
MVVLIIGDVLRVSVSDENPVFPTQREDPDPYAVTGRGLHLVRSLTHRFGTEPRKTGKSVWFELDAAA